MVPGMQLDRTSSVSGAGRGNRTPTGLLVPADFKSAASANFAIPARIEECNSGAEVPCFYPLS